MKHLNKIILALGIPFFVGLAGLTIMPQVVHASPKSEVTKGITAANGGNECDDDSCTTLEGTVKTITDVLLFIVGAVAVIMIIIGGIRYSTSGGDAGSIKGAKDTILYAVIGLVVAILAYAIVNFVLGAFK